MVGRAVTLDQRDPYVKMLATLRECKLRDHYADEQRELQHDLAVALRDALGSEFTVQISVDGDDAPKPRVPAFGAMFGASFWPDIGVSQGSAPLAAVEVKYIREKESPTAPIAEAIGQALIYRVRYPQAVAFILREGKVDAESEPEARLRESLARYGVDLVVRHR